MKRKLKFASGIISGDLMREIVEAFPETKDSFERRKSFDEYYYKDTMVNVSIDIIEILNDNWNKLTITKDEILIEE